MRSTIVIVNQASVLKASTAVQDALHEEVRSSRIALYGQGESEGAADATGQDDASGGSFSTYTFTWNIGHNLIDNPRVTEGIQQAWNTGGSVAVITPAVLGEPELVELEGLAGVCGKLGVPLILMVAQSDRSNPVRASRGLAPQDAVVGRLRMLTLKGPDRRWSIQFMPFGSVNQAVEHALGALAPRKCIDSAPLLEIVLIAPEQTELLDTALTVFKELDLSVVHSQHVISGSQAVMTFTVEARTGLLLVREVTDALEQAFRAPGGRNVLSLLHARPTRALRGDDLHRQGRNQDLVTCEVATRGEPGQKLELVRLIADAGCSFTRSSTRPYMVDGRLQANSVQLSYDRSTLTAGQARDLEEQLERRDANFLRVTKVRVAEDNRRPMGGRFQARPQAGRKK